jgi:hypothetical protein
LLILLHVNSADARPTLALVSDATGSIAADLLVAELSGSDDFTLVDRDQVWLLDRELAVNAHLSEALSLAARTKADAVLLLTEDADQLTVRLVETGGGVVLLVWHLDAGELDEVAGLLARALRPYATKLALPPGERQLWAILADADPPSTVDALLLARFQSLLAYRLQQQPGIYLVERERLTAVADEQRRAKQLAAAGVVLRCRGERVGDELHCIVQASRGGGEATTQRIVVRYEDLETQATRAVAELAGAAKGDDEQLNLAAEAELYLHAGRIAAAHHDYGRALPMLELACLLQPERIDWHRQFIDTTMRHLDVKFGRNPDQVSYLKEADYMVFAHWLRQAARFQSRQSPASALPFLAQRRSLHLLARDDRKLAAANQFHVSGLRSELQALLAVEQANALGAAAADTLARVLPLFADSPATAIQKLRQLMQCEDFPMNVLWDNVFLQVKRWPAELAGSQWRAFLTELIESDKVDVAAAGHIGRCFAAGAFDQFNYKSPNRATAAATVVNLCDRLHEDPAFFAWMIRREHSSLHRNLWFALRCVSREQQSRYFEQVMLPLMRARPIATTAARLLVRFRWWESRKDETLRAELQQHVREIYAIVHPDGAVSIDDWLRQAMGDPFFASLWTEQVPEPLRFPQIEGATLLLDTGRVEDGDFAGFNACVDGRSMWLAWLGQEPELARIGLDDKQVQRYQLSINGRQAATVQSPLLLARWGQRICLADAFEIHCWPLSDGEPALADMRSMGPTIGELTLRPERHTEDSASVSMLVGAGENLYFALHRPIADGKSRNLFGAVYRWDGVAAPTRLAASNALDPGALNDCLPYAIFAGWPSDDGASIYLALAPSPDQPPAAVDGQRNGVWRFEFVGQQWRQLEHCAFAVSRGALGLPGRRFGGYSFHALFESYCWLPGDALERCPVRVTGPDKCRGFRFGITGGMPRRSALTYTGARGQRLVAEIIDHEFRRKRIVPDASGVYLLLEALRPGGQQPGDRGLVYYVPVDY